MVINVGLRTDIVHHYSEWLLRRFREGVVYARNPLFKGKVTRYILQPDKVDAVLFCSKNYAPILPRLHEIEGSYRTLYHYTLNGYGSETEPGLPPLSDRLATLKELSSLVGREKLYWRYDPIFLTETYTTAFHRECFSELAEKIAPYVSGCIVNFIEMNLNLHQRLKGCVPDKSEKQLLMLTIGSAARQHRLPVRICGYGEDYSAFGVQRGGCATLGDIARANGCTFRNVKHEGNRRGCMCITSRDLGWYDSCPTGCIYCNANRDPAAVPYNIVQHDPASPILIGQLSDADLILQSPQESFLVQPSGQISMFDTK